MYRHFGRRTVRTKDILAPLDRYWRIQTVRQLSDVCIFATSDCIRPYRKMFNFICYYSGPLTSLSATYITKHYFDVILCMHFHSHYCKLSQWHGVYAPALTVLQVNCDLWVAISRINRQGLASILTCVGLVPPSRYFQSNYVYWVADRH